MAMLGLLQLYEEPLFICGMNLNLLNYTYNSINLKQYLELKIPVDEPFDER